MTIIAAQFCGDYIMMATDSRGTHSEQGHDVLATVDPKLNILEDKPIAWGYSGALDVGEDFDRWLTGYVWNAQSNWESFKQDALAELCRLNGNKRKSVLKSGKEPTHNDVADVLITGYINQVPQILEITADAESYFHKQRKFAAIGTGKAYVEITRRVLLAFHKRHLNKQMPDDLFWFMVAEAAQLTPDCGLPAQRAKITPSGVKRLN